MLPATFAKKAKTRGKQPPGFGEFVMAMMAFGTFLLTLLKFVFAPDRKQQLLFPKVNGHFLLSVYFLFLLISRLWLIGQS